MGSLGLVDPEQNPLMRPSFVLRVLAPIVFPIAARTGALLVVSPGHPTHTLAVLTADASRIVRHRHVEDGALYGPILMLDADGAVAFLRPQDRHQLARAG